MRVLPILFLASLVAATTTTPGAACVTCWDALFCTGNSASFEIQDSVCLNFDCALLQSFILSSGQLTAYAEMDCTGISATTDPGECGVSYPNSYDWNTTACPALSSSSSSSTSTSSSSSSTSTSTTTTLSASSETLSSSTPTPSTSSNISSCPVCGNGVVEGKEECDDGNRMDGDGCTHGCRIEESLDTRLIAAIVVPIVACCCCFWLWIAASRQRRRRDDEQEDLQSHLLKQHRR